MTTRRGRRSRMHPALLILAGTGVLVLADVAAWALWVAWHVWPLILAAAVTVYGCRRWQWHRRAWALLTRPARPVEHPEVTRLRAELDQARAALADAELSRAAAWDAAASVPPRQHRAEADSRTRLLADPLSGARRLGIR